MKRIKEEREKLGYNQTEFARKINVANNTLNNWEKGNREPNIETLKLLSDIFGCSVDYIIGKTNIRNAAVIEKIIDDKNVKIELDDTYYKSLTPTQVSEMLEKLRAVGFDLKKLL